MKKTKKVLDSSVKYTLIQEHKSPKLDKLFELYAIDKEKARIFYFLNKNDFWSSRKVLYEESDGRFRFVLYTKKFGISETSKMYSRETMNESISYNGKRLYWYHRVNSRVNTVRDLMYNTIVTFNNSNQQTWNNPDIDNTVINYMMNKFTWLRYISENEKFRYISLNKILINKLYNLKDLFRHLFKCPYPVAEMVWKNMNGYSIIDMLSTWGEIRKRLISVENLKEEMFTNPLFKDTCKLSQMVNKKVNCSWSLNRLKLEHDKWSKMVTNVMIESEPFKQLKIAKIYKDFAEYSGFDLLRTNHDLIIEGKRKNHCVATYVDKVEKGNCGIYRVHDCTLELVIYSGKLAIAQYMDYNNSPAPSVYKEEIKSILDSFNETVDEVKFDFFGDGIENIF